MGDNIILRFPFNDPQKPEIIEVLANVPTNWREYLKRKAKKYKKKGRYIVANILYNKEYYYPESMKKIHKKAEKVSK